MNIGIGNWTEYNQALRLVVTLELRVGDLAGDLAERGFKTVEHEPCPPGTLTLSVTHETINRRKRRDNGIESCGAGIPRECLNLITEWDEGWNRERLSRLCDIADRWHLNTMKAACAHMDLPEDTSYDARKDIVCNAGTGYKYGSGWLVEPLPKDILDELTLLGVNPSN